MITIILTIIAVVYGLALLEVICRFFEGSL